MSPTTDDFADRRALGAVVGTGPRHGRDVEGVFAIDHDALRIKPLTEPGWGRSVLTYGAHERRVGLSLSAHVLNGHNSSENTDPWPGLGRWALQWVRGTQTEAPARRLRARLHHTPRDSPVRLARSWLGNRRALARGTTLQENLAVGWFGSDAPSDALGGGHGAVRALGGDNGAITVDNATVVHGLQNVPVQLVVTLRERGAIVYGASLPDAHGLGSPGELRPLGIDPNGDLDRLHPGVHQSVLGQVAWGVDSRVYGVRIDQVDDLSSWCTSAHAVDRLDGSGPTVGGPWEELGGISVLRPSEPTGLLHATFTADATVAFRCVDERNTWLIRVDSAGATLEHQVDGRSNHRIADDRAILFPVSLQILDDGVEMRINLDGDELFGGPVSDDRFADAVRAVGHVKFLGDAAIRDLEAHPWAIPCPPSLIHDPAEDPTGDRVVFEDDFASTAPDLDGRGHDGRVWSRTIGTDAFELDGSAAVVPTPAATTGSWGEKLASIVSPTGHRTAYTIEWGDPHHADLETEIIAPGTGRGQGEEGRGGLIFWQDDQNYIIVNTWLDDEYDGTSVSSFFHLGGYEEVYDAVWTNVGRRITWGVPYRLRVSFDTNTYLCRVDGEPVLYRALTDVYPTTPPLLINRVGIVSNWEFGDDTGSRFTHFTARMR